MIFRIADKFEESFLVSEKIYEDFIEVSQDRNPLHTNIEFAHSKGFEGVVMHGNILNVFLSYFVGECLPIKDVIIHRQDVEFKNPVYKNDALKFDALVVGIYESVKAVEFKYKFYNQNNQIVAKGHIQIGII